MPQYMHSSHIYNTSHNTQLIQHVTHNTLHKYTSSFQTIDPHTPHTSHSHIQHTSDSAHTHSSRPCTLCSLSWASPVSYRLEQSFTPSLALIPLPHSSYSPAVVSLLLPTLVWEPRKCWFLFCMGALHTQRWGTGQGSKGQ